MPKVTEMKVGQVWQSLDPREGPTQKMVMSVTNGKAAMQALGGSRKTTVDCDKFLKRQGTKSGYTLVRGGE